MAPAIAAAAHTVAMASLLNQWALSIRFHIEFRWILRILLVQPLNLKFGALVTSAVLHTETQAEPVMFEDRSLCLPRRLILALKLLS